MTAPLERHYRRLLAVYPAAYRHIYEEEIVAVLMEGAEPGRRRPSPAEAADLLRSGFRPLRFREHVTATLSVTRA